MYATLIPGNVPPFEEHDARREAGYRIPEWYKLEPGARAIEVAMYRLKKAMELIGGDAMDAYMKRKMRKRGV